MMHHNNSNRGDNKMGERNTSHKETKKKKKTDANAPAPSTYVRPVMIQPELIKKKKKPI
jgi:hypothetical protein